MKLLRYNNRKVRLIDTDNEVYEGMAYYEDADTAGENEDILTIETNNLGYTKYLDLFESDIKSIEIID